METKGEFTALQCPKCQSYSVNITGSRKMHVQSTGKEVVILQLVCENNHAFPITMKQK